MDIRAVMCDVDGTLLTSRGVCSPATVEAIKAVRERGLLFGLCTGRDAKSAEKQLGRWGIDGLVDAIVGAGGGEVCDYRLDVRESRYPLSGEAIREIMDHFQDMPVNFVIPCDGMMYVPFDDVNVRELSEADKMPYTVVDFDEFLKEPRSKVMLTFKPETMPAVQERAKTFSSERFRSAALVTASVLYEYMDPRISKANGLARWAELNGFALENICAFGDEDNDEGMVHAVGLGVAMANGSEKTRAAADVITADNDHDGIAAFIHERLLA